MERAKKVGTLVAAIVPRPRPSSRRPPFRNPRGRRRRRSHGRLLEYLDVGHVKDDEKDKIDAGRILADSGTTGNLPPKNPLA